MENSIIPEKINFSEKEIEGIAHESAEYLLRLWRADDNIDEVEAMYMLAQCCMAHNEIAVYVKIRNYCKTSGNALPQHFEELAANPDHFDLYCKYLVRYMAELPR